MRLDTSMSSPLVPARLSSAEEPQFTNLRLLIGAEWVEPELGTWLPVVNPSTEELLTRVPQASSAEVDRAVNLARQAFEQGPWPRLSPLERALYLRRLADLVEENLDLFAELETLDTGLPLIITRNGHVPRAIENLRFYAEASHREGGDSLPSGNNYLHVTSREPIGVAAVLVPWNAPLSLATSGIAAALACGNTCVLKPSELAPLTVSTLVQLATEAEFPPGVLQLLHGPGSTGESLVAHPNVDVVCFTGSTAVGCRVAEICGRSLKRLVCELGGKSASIIFSDAPIDRTVDGVMLSLYSNNGTSCLASSRILIARPLYERFISDLVNRSRSLRLGPPTSRDTELGPLISAPHLEKALHRVREAIAEGARLLTGGRHPDSPPRGFYMEPTLLDQVDPQMQLVREEILAPVGVLVPFDEEDEAVALANSTHYGLADMFGQETPSEHCEWPDICE